VITPPAKRSQLLDGMQASLANVDKPAEDYSSLASPFVPRTGRNRPTGKVEELPAEVIATTERLPDAVALKVIGDRFKPIGSLVLGSRGVLQIANGRSLETGETFTAEIRGHNYEVEVLEVTSQGYALRLGSSTIRKNFITTTGATQ